MKYTKDIVVEFLNPRRPVRSWCDGYLQKDKRTKDGVVQCRVFIQCGSSSRRSGLGGYFVWVNESDIFSYS